MNSVTHIATCLLIAIGLTSGLVVACYLADLSAKRRITRQIEQGIKSWGKGM